MINRFKDRKPEETIQIVKKYFEDKGYKIVEEITTSECNTWSCQIMLSINDRFLFGANGKGVTKEYALASGYAEMFERFSNKICIYSNPFWGKNFIQTNYNKNGYYIDSEEILDTFDNFLKEPLVEDYLNTIFKEKENQKKYLEYCLPISAIKVPYISYISNEIKYFDPRLITKMFTSSGMAAGNTLEEALIQGISEIFEHYTAINFFKELQETYYEIDQKYLPQSIQEKINLIKKNDNYSFKIYDLSYNFNLPVCMSILINKTNLSFHPNFGSAPTLELAVERVITETYQNKKDFSKDPGLRTPFLAYSWAENVAKGFDSFVHRQILNEKFFEKKFILINPKDNKNEIYIKNFSNITNKKILEEYVKICKKFNTDIIYRNNSQIKEMFAIQIFCPGLKIRNHEDVINNQIIKEKEKENFKKGLIIFNSFLEDLYDETHDFNVLDYKRYSSLINSVSKIWNMPLFSPLLMGDWMKPIPPGNSLIGTVDLFQIVNEYIDLPGLYGILETYEHKKKAKYYATLKGYIKAGYTKEEIKQIFKVWNIEIPDDDFKYYDERWYLLKNIFIENFRSYIQSDVYKQFINSFCN